MIPSVGGEPSAVVKSSSTYEIAVCDYVIGVSYIKTQKVWLSSSIAETAQYSTV